MNVYDDTFRQNGEFEDINIDINNFNTNNNTNSNFNMNENTMNIGNNGIMMGTMQGPIIEPGRERVIQRNIVHEVKHVCPMNTKIINNHIFKHTYQPHYTCCEENTVTNVQCGSCCNFN